MASLCWLRHTCSLWTLQPHRSEFTPCILNLVGRMVSANAATSAAAFILPICLSLPTRTRICFRKSMAFFKHWAMLAVQWRSGSSFDAKTKVDTLLLLVVVHQFSIHITFHHHAYWDTYMYIYNLYIYILYIYMVNANRCNWCMIFGTQNRSLAQKLIVPAGENLPKFRLFSTAVVAPPNRLGPRKSPQDF